MRLPANTRGVDSPYVRFTVLTNLISCYGRVSKHSTIDLAGTEPVMMHELKRIPRFEEPVEIMRVATQDLAEQVNKAARSRQILPEHLGKDSPLRQYAALVDDKPVGWVRSIDVEQATWCADMYVVPEFRRRGIARAMMAQMLRDDRAHGSKLAVLTASHAGAKLYPIVGYKQIGTLMLYTPKKD